MSERRLLMDTIADMTAASVERANLSDEALLLVRFAALVAMDAPVASYLLNFGAAAETDLTLEDAQSVLVAVAPIVGAPRVVSAAGKITEALGIAIELAELEMEEGL